MSRGSHRAPPHLRRGAPGGLVPSEAHRRTRPRARGRRPRAGRPREVGASSSRAPETNRHLTAAWPAEPLGWVLRAGARRSPNPTAGAVVQVPAPQATLRLRVPRREKGPNHALVCCNGFRAGRKGDAVSRAARSTGAFPAPRGVERAGVFPLDGMPRGCRSMLPVQGPGASTTTPLPGDPGGRNAILWQRPRTEGRELALDSVRESGGELDGRGLRGRQHSIRPGRCVATAPRARPPTGDAGADPEAQTPALAARGPVPPCCEGTFRRGGAEPPSPTDDP